MSGSEPSEFVVLDGGLTLPVAVVRLALDLEARGCRLELEGESLLVGPRDLLTDEDREQIRRWRDHLRTLVPYASDRVH